jgi:hypothetical protein
MGRPEDRGVVAVTQRERVGQRVVKGQVGALVVAHRHRAVGPLVGGGGVHLDPGVHLAVVPAQVLRTPVVGQVIGALHPGGAVEVEGQQLVRRHQRAAAWIILGEYAERVGGVVVEAAAAGIVAEVVVIGAVLHHQEDDVFDRP